MKVEFRKENEIRVVTISNIPKKENEIIIKEKFSKEEIEKYLEKAIYYTKSEGMKVDVEDLKKQIEGSYQYEDE